MVEDKVIIRFPRWEMVERLNDVTEYRGFTCRYHISKDLYVLIEVLNESLRDKKAKDQLRFSFSTKEGAAIASIKYDYSEDRYYIGIGQLMRWAEEFEEAFSWFRETTIMLGES